MDVCSSCHKLCALEMSEVKVALVPVSLYCKDIAYNVEFLYASKLFFQLLTSNASTAFATNLLSGFASLMNHFFKNPSSFGVEAEPPVPPPPPKTPVIASTMIETGIDRAAKIDNFVITFSRKRLRILFAKGVSLARTFSRVDVVLATCVWRSFQFCESISNLVCFSTLRLSNLFLYSSFCSLE